jgi:hypothetical protein
MRDDHLGQVDTFAAEQVNGQPARLGGAGGVYRDRRTGPEVGTGDRPRDAVDPRSEPAASTQYLSSAAFTPLVPMPLTMSRVKSVIIGSGTSNSSPGPR